MTTDNTQSKATQKKTIVLEVDIRIKPKKSWLQAESSHIYTVSDLKVPFCLL